ncbi:hypothetical protein BDW22DRAFT_1416447 [Trametopsis cervina]|nr:hypothetical protein BDW22DRAFT_1416447 [Trametopsis cervina]
MSLKALFYAYVLGGLTFIPLLLLSACFYAIYTSVPVGDPNVDKLVKAELEQKSQDEEKEKEQESEPSPPLEVNDMPKSRKGWLTVRRTFEELPSDGSYVGMVRGFLDARSKDPKRSRPKDMWYVVLKGKVLYLYEDESMTECEAVIELGGHDVVVYPEGLPDGELYAKRNAICLKPKLGSPLKRMPSITKEMLPVPDYTSQAEEKGGSERQKQKEKARAQELEKKQEDARQEALDPSTPWFIFVKSNFEMEDWYLSFIHASDNPPNTPTLNPLHSIFRPADMLHLVETLDEQPDVIPMRWLNALLGRVFFSYYRTQKLEAYIIRRLMHKLSKIKRPTFLTDVSVREVSVGNRAPTLSKPMLKELTKEGDASLEVHLHYKGEIRITVDATATINLGARFKSYTVKLVLAAVLREIEGNLLVKVKRPPSSRIWYAFTQVPRMVLDVEPVVSERQITWSMILSTIESRMREVILESIVLPNMDDVSFFDSFEYDHRGGIWADAARHERSSELYPSSSGEAAEEGGSTVSAPAVEVTQPAGSDPELVGIERSNSAPVELQADEEAAKDAADSNLLNRAHTVAGPSPSPATSPRRRTWFTGSQGDDANPTNTDGGELSDSGPRGRPTESLTRRISSSRSVPLLPETDTLRSTSAEPSADTDTLESRRSSSRHSQASSSQSQDGQPPQVSEQASTSSQADSLFSGFRPKSPGHQKTPSTSPTNNFFQTLKSRDKQAISNTAKEAIRKWGVSWGTLKKDNPPASDDDTASDTDSQRQADGRTHRPKPSYADVRAAVAQRKGAANADGLLSPDFVPSESVAIPRAKERTTSISSLHSHTSAASPSTSPVPDLPLPDNSHPRSVSPAPSPLQPPQLPPRTRTVSHQSQSQPGSESVLGPSVDDTEPPARVIQSQPSAPKAMMIPGIHASHRGEVMSMGYVAPTPPSEPKKQPAAIQSVYRLWKAPSNQSSSSSDPPQSDSQPGDQDVSSASVSTGSSSSSATAVPLTFPARPVPPPLPPRSASTNAVQIVAEPPRHPPGVDRTSPPASAALMGIVERDDEKRSSLDLPRAASEVGRTGGGADDEGSVANMDGSVGQDGVPTQKPRPPALPPRRTQPAVVAQ